MSIASNATDKQVGEILEAIQDITPEVVAQAVAYSQVMNSVWLWIFFGAGVSFLIAFCRSLSIWKRYGKETYALIVFLSGCGMAFCFVGSAACANDLIKLSIAPDYYAAECIARLLGR